ncbi:NAD(P)H azoreductase [Streptomyces sp. RB5]|uniref:NAD(P)H azoreductase n=1 Tax=Streptomyces smaragdinus TaxID=2585196 RepID=A0A7K0CFT7_9ACTN|nr:NAD(P)H-binding protein [Streptomyces smaragdinus]MQY11604.1 NAD(P)H azoreductase [Streptomyces smaragdinus]
MILVIGSTGTVGRRVVAGLSAAGRRVRAFTRDPARADFGPGVEVAVGDLGRPDTVRKALDGVDGVFVLSAGPDALRHELAVADAVRRLGVRRVVKLSSVAAVPPVTPGYGDDHAAAEQAFAGSGADWTALRGAGFMSNVLQWRRSIAAEDTVYQPFGELPRALVAPGDVSDAAVACLLRDDLGGEVFQLTGPQALTTPQQVAAVAALLGRPLKYVEAPAEFALKAMVGAGLPEPYAAGLLAANGDPEPLRGGTVLPDLERLIVRPACTFDAWLARNKGEFTTA